MFEWCPLFAWQDERTVLKLRGTEVARLTQRADGTGWRAILNQHLPASDPRRIGRPCRNFETGKAGVEEWARRHAERLEREVAAIEARQHRLG